MTWIEYSSSVKPHGTEWKKAFQKILRPFQLKQIFPQDINTALEGYMRNPKASSCSDLDLLTVLRSYDKDPILLTVEDIPENSLFIFDGSREFRKIGKARKRHRCQEVSTGKVYMFSPAAPVEIRAGDE
jgi:hypothetical protein